MSALASYSPVVFQTIDDIHDLIEHEEMLLGGRLPSERSLAERLGVSRSTVRMAFVHMRNAGELEIRRGRNGGAFIVDGDHFWEHLNGMNVRSKSSRLIDRQAGSAEGFSNTLAAQGVKYETRVLSAVRDTCSASICEQFGIEGRGELFRIERVRASDEGPVSFEQTYIDPRRFPHFLQLDLSQSIYDLLRETCTVCMERVEERVDVVGARGKSERFLGVEPGYPLMRVVSKAMDGGDGVVVVSKDCYKADRVCLSIVNDMRSRGSSSSPEASETEGEGR